MLVANAHVVECHQNSERWVATKYQNAESKWREEPNLACVSRIAIANTGAIVGWLLTAVLVPPSTPVWLWALLGTASLVIINVVMRPRIRAGLSPTLSWPGSLGLGDSVWLVVTLLLLLLGCWVRVSTSFGD